MRSLRLSFAVAQAAVGAPKREGRVVTAAELRPEVEQAVACVDLAAVQSERVRPRSVDPRLARDGEPKAGIGDEAAVAIGEEACRVAECLDLPAELRLQCQLRARDLVPRSLILKRQETLKRNFVRAAPQRSIDVDGHDPLQSGK